MAALEPAIEPVIEFDIGERMSGRTTRLIEWAAAAPEGELRVVVSHTWDMARNRWRQARAAGILLEEWQFTSFAALAQRSGSAGLVLAARRGRVVLGIDDINYSLGALLGFEVGRVTAVGKVVA